MVLGCSAASHPGRSVQKEVRKERVAEEPHPYVNVISRGVIPRPMCGSRGSRRNERLTNTYTCRQRPFNPASWHMLAAAIKTEEMMTNAHVEVLDLVNCGLVGDDIGVELFCDALADNKTLKELLLSDNNLGANPSRRESEESFAARLSRAIAVNGALTTLMLNDNLLKERINIAL